MTRTATAAASPAKPPAAGILVTDAHARLCSARVAEIAQPRTAIDLARLVATARRRGLRVAVAGSRHSMGGQQMLDGGLLVDATALDRELGLDRERGFVTAGAGMTWPKLMRGLATLQDDAPDGWAIRQKQTGADELTLGGAVGSNIHGRGLTMRPLIGDIEALTVVSASGAIVRCSRHERPELFRRVVGGYGLFGIVTAVTLRLQRRHAVRRLVEMTTAPELMTRLEARIAEGCTFGDFQFSTDMNSIAFLHDGVLSCYLPETGPAARPAREASPGGLSADDWLRLIRLAHEDRARAFDLYSRHYLATHGQIHASDTHQLASHLDGYHDRLPDHPGREVITELTVPRHRLAAFLAASATTLRARRANIIYGTVRLIERDDETALAWAREPWACVVINLHVGHGLAEESRAAGDFRALHDLAIAEGGSFYLTYHRWATGRQLLAAHPSLPAVLRDRARFDPDGTFDSAWARAITKAIAAPA